jgi:ribosome-binding protein aMBF1 (putative translation factor)
VSYVDYSQQVEGPSLPTTGRSGTYRRDVGSDYGDELTLALAEQFRRLREQRGWSMAQLAERALLHRSSIHLVEHGQRGLSIAAGARISAALGVPLSEVVASAEEALRGRSG